MTRPQTAKTHPEAASLPNWLRNAAKLQIPNTQTPAWVDILQFTPVLAAQVLSHNGKNRNIKQHLVKRYVRSMLEDMFVFNGQTIVFDQNGRLLDGQHRLTSCAESGKPFTALVVWGVDATDDVMASMDTGSGRSRADVLRIQYGVKDAAVGTACGHLYNHFHNGGLDAMWKRRISLSHWQTCRIFEEFPEVQDMCRESKRIGRIVSSGVLGALRVILSRYDRAAEKDFFEKLVTGVNLPENHPVLALKRAFTDWAALKGQGAKHRAASRSSNANVWLFAVAIKAWNAFCQGQTIGIGDLGWNADKEVFPAIIQDAEAVKRQHAAQQKMNRIAREARKAAKKAKQAENTEAPYGGVSFHG